MTIAFQICPHFMSLFSTFFFAFIQPRATVPDFNINDLLKKVYKLNFVNYTAMSAFKPAICPLI